MGLVHWACTDRPQHWGDYIGPADSVSPKGHNNNDINGLCTMSVSVTKLVNATVYSSVTGGQLTLDTLLAATGLPKVRTTASML